MALGADLKVEVVRSCHGVVKEQRWEGVVVSAAWLLECRGSRRILSTLCLEGKQLHTPCLSLSDYEGARISKSNTTDQVLKLFSQNIN